MTFLRSDAANSDGDGRVAPAQQLADDNARLRAEVENLRGALETRSVIDMAKGILIARVGCDATQAFGLLVAQSQHENRKVRDIADELVKRNVRVGSSPTTGDGQSAPPPQPAADAPRDLTTRSR